MNRRAGLVFVTTLTIVAATAASAQVVSRITKTDSDFLYEYAIDGSGSTLVAVSSADLVGLNPSHRWQIFQWTYPGATPSQLTTLPEGVMQQVSISDDGSTIAFRSPADPLGTNPDHGVELFLMDASGTVTVQLTDDDEQPQDFVLSGSGNRVVFFSYADPLGTNPTNEGHLFAIDSDGTNLTQVTASEPPGGADQFDVSDGGSFVVYARIDAVSPQQNAIFLIRADGTGLQQLDADHVERPKISGNGGWIVYQAPGGLDPEIRIVPRSGGTPTVLGEGDDPVITDDGLHVYYSGRDGGPPPSFEIFEVEVDLQMPVTTQLTFTSNPVQNRLPVVSGDGSRVAYTVDGGPIPPAVNPDGSTELAALDVSGPTVEQLTENAFTYSEIGPGTSADGERILFRSWANYEGSNPAGEGHAFLVEPETGAVTRLSADPLGGLDEAAAISGDGQLVAYLSSADPFGTNPGNHMQVFTISADGTGLAQRTADTVYVPKFNPTVTSDGSFVLFESPGDYAGQNPDASIELFSLSLSDATIAQISTDLGSWWANHRLSADDQWVVYNSRTNQDGLNPNEDPQIFLARTDGSSDVRITAYADGAAQRPTVSGDGGRIAFVSDGDPLGTNADHGWEVFLYDTATMQTQQLTLTAGAAMYAPTITPDGRFVFFFSDAPFTGTPEVGLYRLTVSDGIVRRASGLRDVRGSLPAGFPYNFLPSLVVDASGRAVLVARGNLNGENDDVDRQVWRVDFDAPADIRPSKTGPTVVQWDAEPEPYTYDVIRGDVANLAAGAGGTTDLGSVVCLENDSRDNDTVGFEDATQPGAGEVFFYLRRGFLGTSLGDASWGTGAAGERVPASGSCN